MDRNQKEYKIKITDSAEKSYLEILDYVFEYYTEKRALEIAEDLLEIPFSLKTLPNRGKLENSLLGRKKNFRFILYKRNSSSTIKIIYYVDEKANTVFITDYFPTEMTNTKIKNRS